MEIAVLGLGRFGRQLARTLASEGHNVLAVDHDERIVQDLADEVTKAAILDITNAEALEDVGVGHVEVGVIATTEVEASVLAALNLQALQVPTIHAKAGNERHATILRRLGVQRVVIPEEEGGERFSHLIRMPGSADYLPLTPGYGIGVYTSPENWTGQTLEWTLAPAKGEGSGTRRLLMIVRGETVQLNPVRTQAIEAGDQLVFAGSDDDLRQLLLE